MSEAPRRRPGPRTRARRRRTSVRVLLVLVALVLTGGAVYAGLRAGDDGAASPTSPAGANAPGSHGTSLADVDLSDLPIERRPFCGRLSQHDVETALSGPVASTAHYDSGDRLTFTPGVTDISHEYGCRYRGESGIAAQVWVFAEPVSATVGRRIVRDASDDPGCSAVAQAPTYGTPGAGTMCTTKKPAARAVTLRGLFGDAWLSCRVAVPGGGSAADAVRRTDQFCVRVATTLGARP